MVLERILVHFPPLCQVSGNHFQLSLLSIPGPLVDMWILQSHALTYTFTYNLEFSKIKKLIAMMTEKHISNDKIFNFETEAVRTIYTL